MATIARDETRARKSPEAVFRALTREIEALQQKITDALEQCVQDDARKCPGIPQPVLKGLRTARHCYGFCLCAWARDEAKQHEGGDA